jgi:MoxR-like ATPase
MSRHDIDRSIRFSVAQFAEALKPEKKRVESPEHFRIEGISVKDGKREVELSKPTLVDVPCEPYVAGESLVEAINMAIALGRPLLLQGDPGCGKTRLAHALAYATALPLEQAYIKSTSRAQDLLYTFDAVRRLYDLQSRREQPDLHYVRLGPLGRAIARASEGRRSVVLLDEIDKADIDYPNDLLWELDRLTFELTELDGLRFAVDRPDRRPIVVVTHNEEKALPTAFLRRCVFFHIDFPTDRGFLTKLLTAHGLGSDAALTGHALEIVAVLRKLDLTKKPGLSELLDWVGYLKAEKTPVEKLTELPHPGLLIKQAADLPRAQKALSKGPGDKKG